MTGAGGLNQAASVGYSGDCLNVTVANGCTATATFGGNTNHSSSSDTKSITITQAPSTTVVAFEAGPYIYRGTAFTATANVTGAGGLNQPVSVVYSGDCLNVTGANGCTATATFAGDTNHLGSSDAKSITITQAPSTTVVTFEAGPYTYRGTAFTATANVTGVGGLNQAVPVVYSGDCLNVTVANGCTATATFAGDTNHLGSSDVKSITITKANQTIDFPGPLGPYTIGIPFTVSATATSGLPVTFSSQTPDTCTVSGDQVTPLHAGICTIRASQTGNDNYNAAPDVDQSGVVNLGPAVLWVGLKNSDDQGTGFDVRVEVYSGSGSTLVAAGEYKCIPGVTRNPSLATKVTVPLAYAATYGGEKLSTKIYTRIGTNPDGSKCTVPGGSHKNATGLRLYYDSKTQASQINNGDSSDGLYLHTVTTVNSLVANAPLGSTANTKDSPA